jgi:hypothetical protein
VPPRTSSHGFGSGGGRTVPESTVTSTTTVFFLKSPKIIPSENISYINRPGAPALAMGLERLSANRVYDGVLTKYRFKVRLLSPAYFRQSDSAIVILECCIGWFDGPIQPLHSCKRFLNTQSSGIDLSGRSYLHRRQRVRCTTKPLTQHIANPLNRQCSKGRFHRPSCERGNCAPFPGHLTSWCRRRRRRCALGFRHWRWLLSQRYQTHLRDTLQHAHARDERAAPGHCFGRASHPD